MLFGVTTCVRERKREMLAIMQSPKSSDLHTGNSEAGMTHSALSHIESWEQGMNASTLINHQERNALLWKCYLEGEDLL